MKSTAVYKTLREVVDPWAKSAGFKRGAGGMLNYARPVDVESGGQMFWFQCSQDGWDPYTGSKFTLEFQESLDPRPGTGKRRIRFLPLLTAAAREEVRLLQNLVIKQLRPPPQDHWAHTLDANARKWYFARFNPIHDPFGEHDDVWMRYVEQPDVRRWAEFLVSRVPQMLETFAARIGVAGSGA